MADVGHVLGTLTPWLHQYGAAAVFLILTLESLGLPLPGETLLVTAAILAGRGDISFSSLLFSAWAGAVTGDNVGYLIGRFLGRKLLRRYGAKIGLNAERLGKVEAIFMRYGSLTVGFARFVNVLRQLNGVVAGSLEMGWRRFLIFNAFGAVLWVLTWTLAGFYLGQHGADINALLHHVGVASATVALFVAVLAVLYLYRRRTLARRERALSEETRASIDATRYPDNL